MAGGAAGAAGAGGAAPVSYKNCIQLAACAAGQALPMNPELPADLFTACLTTPVKMAMKWFVLRERTRVAPADVHDLIDKYAHTTLLFKYYDMPRSLNNN